MIWPLQLRGLRGLDLGEWLLVASDGLTVLLGIVISYFAYVGYRRNDSRPMLFVSTGFFLVFAVPGGLFVVYLFVPAMGAFELSALTQISEVLGMGGILYGIVAGGSHRVRSE